MFTMILRTQWAWTRLAVATLSAVTFLLPVMIWRIGSGAFGGASASTVIASFELTGILLTIAAFLGAVLLAALPWTVDAEARHVYALSLPIRWSRFVAMRYGAGALTLLLPALSLYLGCLALLSILELPPLLRGYPGALALRFLLASLMAYSASFALQYVAGRQATIAVLVALLMIGGLSVVLWLFGTPDAVDSVLRFLFVWPGPFAVFSEPWTLIDV